MKKVACYTLGCKLNFSETSTIARGFQEKGYQKVDFSDTPDIYIINTCSVTENADKKCKKVVREAQKVNPEAYVAIIGCYAQLKPKEISEMLHTNLKKRILPIIHFCSLYTNSLLCKCFVLKSRDGASVL